MFTRNEVTGSLPIIRMVPFMFGNTGLRSIRLRMVLKSSVSVILDRILAERQRDVNRSWYGKPREAGEITKKNGKDASEGFD